MSQIYLVTILSKETSSTWLTTVGKGGLVGYIIIALSLVALALIILHFLQIRRRSLLPEEQLVLIEDLLAKGKVEDALGYCVDPANDSYLTRILGIGLMRYQRSAFGPFELKNALEEAGEDQTSRLFRSTDALGLIGTIAPLLGLLGTVFGMVEAFDSISSNTPTALAGNISVALVTTMLGLVLAIPCLTLFSFFRNRIEGLSAEAAAQIERLVLHLEEAPTS
jgi:biopolymer transport protein ExbB